MHLAIHLHDNSILGAWKLTFENGFTVQVFENNTNSV